ncbi:hypothetical protein QTP88_018407 [Uroleucon formosanum]
MEEKLRGFDDINEKPTIGDLADLLFSVAQFAGGVHEYSIVQPDDNSKAGPVETIQDDMVVTPTAQETEEVRSDEAMTWGRGIRYVRKYGTQWDP